MQLPVIKNNQPSLELQAQLLYSDNFPGLRQLADNEPRLTKATITFATHNDNKDDDTLLFVQLKTKVSLFLSKDLTRREELGHNTEFNDPSTHTFNLPLASENIRQSELTLPIVEIQIQPNGNDRWIFDYQVALTFDDGNTYSSNAHGVMLDQDNRSYTGVFEG
nr:hypothetical protein [uncultured Chitinophaga sp.]